MTRGADVGEELLGGPDGRPANDDVGRLNSFAGFAPGACLWLANRSRIAISSS
jgi:hypothetical protein